MRYIGVLVAFTVPAAGVIYVVGKTVETFGLAWGWYLIPFGVALLFGIPTAKDGDSEIARKIGYIAIECGIVLMIAVFFPVAAIAIAVIIAALVAWATRLGDLEQAGRALP